MKVTKNLFGTTEKGEKIHSFLLENDNQMQVEIIEYGAIVVRIKVPDKNGKMDDVVLGYDNLQGYINDQNCFGATIGRVAGRIGGAAFSIYGKKYELAPNTLPDLGKNHLHGGIRGFNKAYWKGVIVEQNNTLGVELSYLSKDGEEGYPGNLDCSVKYSLNNKDELSIRYTATTDKPTVVNLTHHSYFNLAGEGNGNILDHRVMIDADRFTVEDDNLIPTGEIKNVEGLPVDFTRVKTIGSGIDKMQMAKYKGYDLNYILNQANPEIPVFAARAAEPGSGRLLEVFTTQPCIQFYTSNFDGNQPGKGGKTYAQSSAAFCFEPQAYPDAPNHADFPSIVLHPGEEYKQLIIYRFTAKV